MILLNDGEFIVGSTWVVGYKPTDEDSVKIKGGLWLNEVGIEDTKKEPTMIDLSKAKVGDKFEAQGKMFESVIFELVLKGDGECVMKEGGGGLHISDNSGVIVKGVVTLYKKHEPRWWLKDLPDADIFEGEWLACENEDCYWYLYQGEPLLTGDGANFSTNGMFALGPLMGIKMPKLTGDEWKQSKISIAELREWQKANG